MAAIDFKNGSSLVDFGIRYLQKYENTKASCDIGMAISLFQMAVRLKSISDGNRALYSSNLGSAFLRRYQTTGNVSDLDQAICSMTVTLDAFESAELQLNKQEQDNTYSILNMKPIYLNNAGGCYLERFQRFHKIDDLKSAIKLLEEAIELTPISHLEIVARLSNLGAALVRLYESENDVKYLDQAIEHLEKARNQPNADPSEHLSLLCNLGGALYKRYEATERLESLQSAITIANESFQRTPLGHYDLAGRLLNLANMLESRYLRLGWKFDLWAAMKHAEIAVQITCDNPTEKAIHLDALAMKRDKWYRLENSGRVSDQYLRKLVKDFPPSNSDDPDNARRLQNHADLYGLLHSRTHNDDDLRLAIALSQASVEATTNSHPSRAHRLRTLGLQQLARQEPSFRLDALSSFCESWGCKNGHLKQRLLSAVEAVDLLIERGYDADMTRATEMAADAVRLLPLVNRRDFGTEDMLHVLPRFAGLAAKASSLILLKEPNRETTEKALEILELGRGSSLRMLMDQKWDVSALREKHVALADEFESLRIEMSTDSGKDGLSASGGSIDHGYNISDRFERCVNRVREVPGFENLMMAESASKLQEEAGEGPLIIINVTSISSGAIIVQRDTLKYLDLFNFTAESLDSHQHLELLNFNDDNQMDKNQKYLLFLQWLWTACVKPIFKVLEFPEKTPVPLNATPQTRIWWIGVGKASCIPFHAAGNHSKRSRENVLHYAASSYTPTIKALGFARERFLTLNQTPFTRRKLCLVTMPTTPGFAELHGLSQEVDGITDTVANAFEISALECPSALTVKTQIQHSDVLHFAGHGDADSVNPFKSSIILKTDAGKSDPLSVGAIWEMDLRQAQLVYLSACSTAETRNWDMVDEVIHLVSGFQVAGFANVVGTMWKADSAYSVELAKAFYANLRGEGGDDGGGVDVLSRKGVAAALHSALMRTRRSTNPLGWALYAHFGV